MITEDYVSFETAKLLKEKGFDERCICYYNTESLNKFGYPVFDSIDMPLSNSDLEQSDHDYVCYSAPTLQMAMKWLREEKYIFVELSVDTMIKSAITWRLFEFPSLVMMPYEGWAYNYEDACEAAIKYCLKNLI